jgi:NAD(P)-dependent dehydrogenase (short-subunit alcohol dehydrogenase family)
MSEAAGRLRSAIVFGARNLGRAVIEALVAERWAVAGVARSQATLDGVTDAGGLALHADVTDPASVYAALEEAAEAHGGVDLALNAASAYGGDRSGPFGGGPIVEANFSGFDSWAALRLEPPSRSCRPAGGSPSSRVQRQPWCRSLAGRRDVPNQASACGRREHLASERSPTLPRLSSALPAFTWRW